MSQVGAAEEANKRALIRQARKLGVDLPLSLRASSPSAAVNGRAALRYMYQVFMASIFNQSGIMTSSFAGLEL